MTAVVIAIRVVDVDVAKNNVVGLHTEGLDGSVLDVQAGDGRIIQAMGVKELGLGLAAVGTFTVPPSLPATVDSVVGCSRDGNVRSRDPNQWAIPLFVAEGGLTAEDNLK